MNFDWFFPKCPMKCPWRFQNIPIITANIRRHLRCSLQWIDTVLVRVMHCCMKIYYNFSKIFWKNCVVSIYSNSPAFDSFSFWNFWTNMIIETSRKIKAGFFWLRKSTKNIKRNYYETTMMQTTIRYKKIFNLHTKSKINYHKCSI